MSTVTPAPVPVENGAVGSAAGEVNCAPEDANFGCADFDEATVFDMASVVGIATLSPSPASLGEFSGTEGSDSTIHVRPLRVEISIWRWSLVGIVPNTAFWPNV